MRGGGVTMLNNTKNAGTRARQRRSVLVSFQKFSQVFRSFHKFLQVFTSFHKFSQVSHFL